MDERIGTMDADARKQDFFTSILKNHMGLFTEFLGNSYGLRKYDETFMIKDFDTQADDYRN